MAVAEQTVTYVTMNVKEKKKIPSCRRNGIVDNVLMHAEEYGSHDTGDS